MTASVRNFPVRVSPAFCAEARAIRPVTLESALAEYAADVAGMSDEQLAVEYARIEALPGGAYRRVLDEEIGERDARALIASMAPTLRWGWSR